MFSQITAAADFLIKKGLQPQIGIVLGTGLGKLVNEISIEQKKYLLNELKYLLNDLKCLLNEKNTV